MPQLSPAPKRFASLLASLTLGCLVTTGCTSGYRGYYLTRPQAAEESDAIVPMAPAPPRSLAMFEGDTGRVATWADLMEGVAWADVIFLGEAHDHAEGHRVETAIAEDTLSSFPGSAVSMEMFERQDQADVDAYLRGEIDVTTLVERTKSLGWGVPGDAKESEDKEVAKAERRKLWDAYYQPTVDVAKARGSRVIAANAPRDYVKKAHSDGYDALRALPENERALFDIPDHLEGGIYRRRFNEVMLGEDASSADAAARQRVDDRFRSQQVWDATMGRSIARALDAVPAPPKIVHIVGGFHIDNRVGTVTQLLAARPNTRVLTVQIIPEGSRTLRDEDRGRADIIIYAAREAKPEAATETPAETTPQTAPETKPAEKTDGAKAGEKPAPQGAA